MLVEHRSPTFEQLNESLSMLIQLTDDLREVLSSEHGTTTPCLTEVRNTPRFCCCGKCIITIYPDSYRMPGQESQSLGIVRDLSRKGIGIIAHQQLYPEQMVELLLENATVKTRVARARREGPFCFEIGLVIVKHELRTDA